VFHDGRWAGIFQFAESGVQSFCQQVKPVNLIDLSTVTSIWRPGALGADVDKQFMEARTNPHRIKFLNDIHQEITGDTYGFLIFQEQIAEMAHKLGKDVSLDEGNMLRKVLTKKGTGKAAKVKKAIYTKFIDGCVEKNLTKKQGEDIWKLFEMFSGYGFNKSHAVSYSMITYQCAWLLTYFPECWLAAFLNEETDGKMEQAISTVKNLGYDIRRPSINLSSDGWEVSKDGSTFYQPLTDIDGVGQAAFDEVKDVRPFKSIEDIIFNPEVRRTKMNKTVLDRLIRSGALNELIDDRFSGDKHFWASVLTRPKNQDKFDVLIADEELRKDASFSVTERVAYIADLTSTFPLDMVVTDEIRKDLEEMGVPPLGDWEQSVQYHWVIPRELKKKKTRNGKEYWDVFVTDSTFQRTGIRCWNIAGSEKPAMNRPYLVTNLIYDEQWGFSIPWKFRFNKSFALVG